MGIENLQKRGLEIAKVFRDLCEQHGWTYYLAGGSLLGAVRHKGFIPWDDDMDFVMPRKDYDQLVHFALTQSDDDRYHVLSYEKDRDFPWWFIKMVDTQSTFIERQFSACQAYYGFAIDVFPLDNYEGDRKSEKLKKKADWLKRLLVIHERDFSSESLLKRMLAFFVKRTSARRIQNKLKKVCLKMGTDVSPSVMGYNGRAVFPKQAFGQGKMMAFEDVSFNAPDDPHVYLSTVYDGDYMVPPPLDQRDAHNLLFVDLDTPYAEYREGKKALPEEVEKLVVTEKTRR